MLPRFNSLMPLWMCSDSAQRLVSLNCAINIKWWKGKYYSPKCRISRVLLPIIANELKWWFMPASGNEHAIANEITAKISCLQLSRWLGKRWILSRLNCLSDAVIWALINAGLMLPPPVVDCVSPSCSSWLAQEIAVWVWIYSASRNAQNSSSDGRLVQLFLTRVEKPTSRSPENREEKAGSRWKTRRKQFEGWQVCVYVCVCVCVNLKKSHPNSWWYFAFHWLLCDLWKYLVITNARRSCTFADTFSYASPAPSPKCSQFHRVHEIMANFT